MPGSGGGGGGIPEAPTDGQKYGRQISGWAVINDGYIDGEVATHADLPVTVGDPVLLSAYLVKEASGLWLINRKPAGVYIRTGNAGSLTDWTYAGAFPDVFNDANFELYDDADSTKKVKFSLGDITTGNTRTLTVPDASGTIALRTDAVTQFGKGAGTALQVLRVNAGETALEFADPSGGGSRLETIWIPAAAMTPATTSGAASASAEKTTNKQMLVTLDFDPGTDEFAQFVVAMPKSWDEGTVTAQFVWTHGATTTNFGVAFGLQGLAVGDDDAIDAAWGTAQLAVDTGGTTDDLYTSPATAAITIGGTPAENDVVWFRVFRDVSDAGDNMAVDAKLIGVKLFITLNAATDA